MESIANKEKAGFSRWRLREGLLVFYETVCAFGYA